VSAVISDKEAMMADVAIQTLKNGPLLVKGPVQLVDAQGKPIPAMEPTIALCRCGHSSHKPFCDPSTRPAASLRIVVSERSEPNHEGSHTQAGFQG